jgi:GNAT superfamily N-acetyltransferase
MSEIQRSIELRRMVEADLPAALALTQQQRWSHRAHDWRLHFNLGRGWIASDCNGTVVGTASWWDFGPALGCIGLVVVSDHHQGQGIGRQLMNAAMSDAAPRALQLVATDAGLKLYQQCGFYITGGIEQHQGIAATHAPPPLPAAVTLRAVVASDLSALCALDQRALGADREPVLRAILSEGAGVLAESAGRIIAYALQRTAGAGLTLGPVVAADQELAIALLSHQLRNNSTTARVDAPAKASRLTQWLASVGLPCIDRVHLMMRGATLPRATDVQVFGLASQALG